MPVQAKQKPKVGAFVPTKTTGIYKRLRADGTAGFYVRFTDASGKRRYELAGTFDQAKARYAEVTGKTTRGEVVADPATTLSNLLPGWRAQRDVIAKPRTRETEERSVRLYIEPKWGRTKVRDIRPNSITTWINGLNKQDGEPMDDSTRALVLAHLSSILNYAIEENVVATNAVKSMPRRSKPKQGKKVPRILRGGELDALLGGLGRQKWLSPILRLLACTGLRLGEVIGLEWGDIDFEAETITVQRQIGKAGKGTTKSGKARVVPMLGAAMVTLMEQRKVIAAEHGIGALGKGKPVFTNSYGGHRQPRDVQRAFDWARDRAGISAEPRALTLHDFRHTVATVLANEPGAVLPQIQAMLGHADIGTTMLYVHEADNSAWRESAGSALAAVAS
jgi:integrase